MTTAEVPTEIGWVRVTLPRLVAVVADTTADPDAHPDGIPVEGTVTFTPNLTAGTVVVASSGVGVLPQSKSFPLVDGSLDAYLIHPGDPDLNPNGWTYSVVLTVPGGAGVASTSIRGVLAVDAGVTDVNLLPLLPLSAASGGTITLTPGPQGDPGPTGEGVPAGGLTGQVLAKATETDFDTEWVTGGAGGGVTDHGALTGLTDDDHPQYHTDTRGDARYSQLGHTHTEYQPTGDYVAATDPRLSDARTPTAHGHSPDDLGAGTPVAGQYLDGDGTWKALPAGGGGGGATPLAMARQNKLYPLTAYDSTNTTVLTGDIINLSTANLPAGATIKRLLIAVKTAASAATNVEIGLYSPAGDLLASGVVDVSTTGNKEVNFASAVTVPPGLVLCAAKLVSASANGAVLHRDSITADPYRSSGNPWDPMGGSARGVSVAHAGTGALPASIAGLTLTEGGVSYAFGYQVS